MQTDGKEIQRRSGNLNLPTAHKAENDTSKESAHELDEVLQLLRNAFLNLLDLTAPIAISTSSPHVYTKIIQVHHSVNNR